jgi:hypothetical protein
MLRNFISLLLLLTLSLSLNAQIKSNKSEMKTAEKIHSAKRATIYSAILPGLGQAYNHKYWKIPIVYAGVGTISYFIISNREIYLQAREAYDYVANGYDYPIDNELVVKYDAADLLEIRDYYRRNLELSWIFMGVWHILNIIDANVDAHFFDYDISDNLTLRIQPDAGEQIIGKIPQNSLPRTGIRVTLNF